MLNQRQRNAFLATRRSLYRGLNFRMNSDLTVLVMCQLVRNARMGDRPWFHHYTSRRFARRLRPSIF